MRTVRPIVNTVALATVLTGGLADAQQPPSVIADLLTDIVQVEEKLVALARAFPEDLYAWRPAPGVRSVGEVFMHVAADNYLLPTAVGVPAPPFTRMDPNDYATVQAYEARAASRDAIIADLTASFAHLKEAMGNTAAGSLAGEVTLFGQRFTTQQLWVITTTHLHEHLGQSIAYARSNAIVPPWSR